MTEVSLGRVYVALVVNTWVGCRHMMRLGYTVKRVQLVKIKVQMSSIWAKGCMLIVCVLSDFPPWWREKVMVYYYYYINK